MRNGTGRLLKHIQTDKHTEGQGTRNVTGKDKGEEDGQTHRHTRADTHGQTHTDTS